MAVVLSNLKKFMVFALFLPSFSTIIVPPSISNSGISHDIDDDFVLLKPNEQYLKNDNAEFKIFCYPSISKSFLHIWRSVYLALDNVPLSYEIFAGVNTSDVRGKHIAQSRWNPSFWFSGQKSSVAFPAFSPYCVGIATQERYAIILKVRTINYWKVLQTILGVLLFLSAPYLSRNPFFHYTSGVSLGVLASLLVLIYVLSRFIPKKSASYAVLVFGYSFILYIIQFIWKDLNDIISNYMDIFLVYCFLTAFISFLVCYRLGPVQNVRTFNIIQWSMQTIAVLLIFLSSEYREVSTAQILIMIGVRTIPSRWIAKIQRIWYTYFPPKVKLLSELEFIEQGHVETKKALEDLRKYCSSPDCNVWRTVTRLKDPLRFAEFIEKGSHCTDQELLQYNSVEIDYCDDDDDDDDWDTTEMNNSYAANRSNGYRR